MKERFVPGPGPVSVKDRWTARIGDDDEGRAGALLRHALRPEPLGEGELAALGARLARAGRAGRRARSPARRLAVAFAIALLGGALVAAAARLTGWVARRQAPSSVAPAPAAPPRRSPAAAPAPAPTPAPAIEPVPVPAPEPAPRPRRRAPTEQAAAEPAPPSAALPPPAAEPAPPSALAAESQLLELALRKLRSEHDPQGALALLDQHRARFAATGALGPEARLARIEALVQMRRHREALALLEPLALAPSGGERELLATRAELRSAAGRCADAIADFDTLLAGGGAADPISERALFGRAACRALRADDAGARADLESYLARFPEGRFAAPARAALRR
jgi:hypothetical protein